MKRPKVEDYLISSKMEYQSQVNLYYADLEKYCDYLERDVEKVIPDHLKHNSVLLKKAYSKNIDSNIPTGYDCEGNPT
jgi:hypothetical protein